MKKIILLLLLVLFPVSLYAKTYDALDSTISIDETKWSVFTRDNILNNEELEELGITYEYMNSLFTSKDMYLDAALFDEENGDNTVELFIIAKSTDVKNNFHKFTDAEVKEFENELVKTVSSNDHNIYSNNNYKYVYIYYSDSGLNICDYYTVINGRVYTIKFQKVNEFNESDKAMIKDMVDSITFKLDQKYEVESTKTFNFMRIIIYAVVGAVIGGITGLISYISKKKKAK